MKKNSPVVISKAVLVYQAGIANVFEVSHFKECRTGRMARLILQSDFRSCEMFARGMSASGTEVVSAWCNEAGDITHRHWEYSDFDRAPFSDSFHPVSNVIRRSME